MLPKLWFLIKIKPMQMFGLLTLAMTASLVFAIVDPLAMKLLIDRGLANQDMQYFFWTVVALVSVGIVVRFGNYWQSLLAQRLKNDIAQRLTTRSYATYFQRDYGQIVDKDDGYYLSRVYEEPNLLAHSGLTFVLKFFSNLITFFAALSVSIFLSWKVTLALSAIVPFLYILSHHFGKKIVSQTKQEEESGADFRGILARGLGAYKTINLFGLFAKSREGVERSLARFLQARYVRVKTSSLYMTISSVLMSMAESAVLILAALDVFYGSLTIGGLLGFMSGFWKMIQAMMNLINQIPEYSKVSAHIDRVLDFNREGQKVETQSQAASSDIVIAKNLEHSYGAHRTFGGVSFQIEPGEKVLVLGPNGSGKSTLAHILTGFLRTQGLTAAPTREKISALLYPLSFFHGSCLDHFSWDDLDAARRRQVQALLAQFDLSDKVNQDPATLSEGERKKLFIALALAKDADLYLIDEPLANVDIRSEQKILEAILEHTKGKTLIAIMHQCNAYIGHFDKIINLGEATCENEKLPTQELNRLPLASAV